MSQMSDKTEQAEIVLDAPDAMEMRIVENVLGRPVHVGVYDTVLKVRITHTSLTLLIQTDIMRDTKRELTFVGTKTSLMGFAYVSGTWTYQGTFLAAQEAAAAPVRHLKYGEPRTPQSVRDQRDWEHMCYRPGTSSQPMDSYERQMQQLGI